MGPAVQELSKRAFSSVAIPERPHIAILDGLRGVAILMVLVVHFYQRELFVGGNPLLFRIISRVVHPLHHGVDLFFVLSGFLITGILLESKGRPGYYRNFYARRTLRIFPLYYATLAVVLGLLPLLVAFDKGGEEVLMRQVWLWVYMADWPINWVWDSSELFKLGHFWSLAVEEHFYLIWPAIVASFSRRRLFLVCLALVGISAACRCGASVFGAERVPLLAWPSLKNVDGIAVGAMIAIGLRSPEVARHWPKGRRLGRWLGGFGIAALVLLLLPNQYLKSPLPATFTGTAVVGFFGLLLLRALEAPFRGALHRVLTSRVLLAFGKYSYGLYVIHGILRPAIQDILDVGAWRSVELNVIWQLLYYFVAIAVSFGLAVLCYHSFEKPFLNLKRHFGAHSAGSKSELDVA